MRFFAPILILLPCLALASPTPHAGGAAGLLPAGVGSLVQRTSAAVETRCSAALVSCHFAAVAADCVTAADDPKSLAVFFPHVGRFAVEAIVRRSANAPEPGIALVRLATAVTGVTPHGLPDAPPTDLPAVLVGFGRGAAHGAGEPEAGLLCATEAKQRPCEAAAGEGSRLCWSLPASPTPGPTPSLCTADRHGFLFVEGELVGISPVFADAGDDAGAHRLLAADAAFLRDVLGDEFGEAFCGLRARVGGPAVRVDGFEGMLGSEFLQAEGVIEVDEHTASLVVALNAADGTDFDLFVKQASPATVSSFDCSDTGPGSVHVCEVAAPAPGAWHVLVSRAAAAAVGRFQVTATKFGPPCADPVNDGRDCDDRNSCTTADRCVAGACLGSPVPGDAKCDDGDPCTRGDACVEGVCVGVAPCGDGVAQKPCEECDDGNSVAGDGCEPDCRVTRKDAFVGYLVRPARDAANRMPRNWNVALDDLRIDDGRADDPENYEVAVAQHVLLPAAAGATRAPAEPGQALVRYRIEESREGVGEPDEDGRYPRAARHVARTWRVETDAGDVVVESKTVASLLVPARIGKAELPDGGTSGDAFVCYAVRIARGVDSELAPGGRFVRGMQSFLADGFRDCSRGAASGPFADTEAVGKCLYDLQKPTELCNPVAVGPVAAPRTTTAPSGDAIVSRADVASSLLCYQAQRAARVRSEAVAGVLGVRVGEVIEPRQAQHRRRLTAEGRPLHVLPGNGLPAPRQVDTMRPELVCVPALASLVP